MSVARGTNGPMSPQWPRGQGTSWPNNNGPGPLGGHCLWPMSYSTKRGIMTPLCDGEQGMIWGEIVL